MEIGDYKKLFEKYGFVVTEADEESVLVENAYYIGAFSMRCDGNVTGAFYDLNLKQKIMKAHQDNMLHIRGIQIGWSFFFYDDEGCIPHTHKERAYDLKTMEWILNRYLICGNAVS